MVGERCRGCDDVSFTERTEAYRNRFGVGHNKYYNTTVAHKSLVTSGLCERSDARCARSIEIKRYNTPCACLGRLLSSAWYTALGLSRASSHVRGESRGHFEPAARRFRDWTGRVGAQHCCLERPDRAGEPAGASAHHPVYLCALGPAGRSQAGCAGLRWKGGCSELCSAPSSTALAVHAPHDALSAPAHSFAPRL